MEFRFEQAQRVDRQTENIRGRIEKGEQLHVPGGVVEESGDMGMEIRYRVSVAWEI